MFKLSGAAKDTIKKRRRVNEVTPYDPSSDMLNMEPLMKRWDGDPQNITDDIRDYLLSGYRQSMSDERSGDFEIEDSIKAIEQGIQEFRKIANV